MLYISTVCLHQCTCIVYLSSWYVGVRNEGWFDPWLLLSAFKKKVLSMGVQYLTGELTAATVDGNKVTSVEVREKRVVHGMSFEFR